MDIKQYKERVIKHFLGDQDGLHEATKEDWKLLGKLFLNASEDGVEGLDEFDQRILTTEEYKKLYEYEPTYGQLQDQQELKKDQDDKQPQDFLPPNPGKQGYDY